MTWYYAAHIQPGSERHLTFASYGHRNETKASPEQTRAHKATTKYNKKRK